MKLKVNRIIPTSVESGPDVFDQMRAEYRQHMTRAQELYERALEAHTTGEIGRAHV